MKRLAIILLSVLPFVAMAQGPSSYATSSRDKSAPIDMPKPQLVDTTLTPEVPFTPMAVSMHGYTKRLSDNKESFILRNETHNYHISRVLLKLVYIAEQGTVVHSREELIDCDIAPGMTQMIAIKSFDTSKIYYYHTTPPQRALGTPYRVKYDILRYDIVVK